MTFQSSQKEKVGWLTETGKGSYILSLEVAKTWAEERGINAPSLSHSMLNLIEGGETVWLAWREIHDSLQKTPDIIERIGERMEEVELLAPIPNPPSFRDFYAFEEHVRNARKRRGLEVIPEWYEIPVFYFSNHQAVIGPNHPVLRPKACNKLDYELEIACVIGKQGRDIKAEEAESYIFGYMILNDWSARDLQMQEMKVGLGPAKGKDFATSIGPYLVTADELEVYRNESQALNLEMKAFVNGRELSSGNAESAYYTFSQMIERASDGVTLYPGDIIGSGTVGTGCILELGENIHRWLEPGDEVILSVTGLGELKNTII